MPMKIDFTNIKDSDIPIYDKYYDINGGLPLAWGCYLHIGMIYNNPIYDYERFIKETYPYYKPIITIAKFKNKCKNTNGEDVESIQYVLSKEHNSMRPEFDGIFSSMFSGVQVTSLENLIETVKCVERICEINGGSDLVYDCPSYCANNLEKNFNNLQDTKNYCKSVMFSKYIEVCKEYFNESDKLFDLAIEKATTELSKYDNKINEHIKNKPNTDDINENAKYYGVLKTLNKRKEPFIKNLNDIQEKHNKYIEFKNNWFANPLKFAAELRKK